MSDINNLEQTEIVVSNEPNDEKGGSLHKDTFLLVFTKLLTMIIDMVCIMLLSRIRTLEEYGTYSQLILIVTLTSTLASVGLPNSITYFLKKYETEEERRNYLSNYYVLTLIISLILGLGLFIAKPLVISYYSNELINDYGFFLFIYPFAVITGESVSYLLVCYRKTALLLLYKLVRSVLLILAVLIVYFVGAPFFVYMICFIAVEAVCSIAVYVIAFVLAKGFTFKLSFSLIKKVLKFSLPLGIAYALGTLTSYFDKMMISYFFTTEQYAVYANSAKELPISFIATATCGALMPRIVGMLKYGNKKDAVELWKNSFGFNYILIAVMVFGIICFSTDVMTFLYSEKYLDGVVVFSIYTGIILLRSTQFGMILIASGKSRIIFYISIGVLVLNVGLNFLFIQLLGFIGPAISTAIVTIFEATAIMIFTKKEMGVKFLELIPWKIILATSVFNGLLFCGFYFLKIYIPLDTYMGSFWESLILGVVWLLIYAAVFYKPTLGLWRKMGVN